MQYFWDMASKTNISCFHSFYGAILYNAVKPNSEIHYFHSNNNEGSLELIEISSVNSKFCYSKRYLK